LTSLIEDSIYKAANLKTYYQKQKMQLSWTEYKRIIEGFFEKIFSNCQLIEDYESHNLQNQFIYELATEDNLYVKYICKSLESYMRNYQKEYYDLKRGRNKKYKRCKECGRLIENTGNKKMYCVECADTVEKRNATIRKRKQREKDRVSRNRNLII
jgi:hypothetical protein